MKVGSLVRYKPWSNDYAQMHNIEDLYGIIVKMFNGYISVSWLDGSYDTDLVDSELELVQ
tara:strand:- start:100 stop:279 length:180 start_codon:yes stop_codon:yes gene_type:complete